MASLQSAFTLLSSAPKPHSSRLPAVATALRSHAAEMEAAALTLGLGGLYGAGSGGRGSPNPGSRPKHLRHRRCHGHPQRGWEAGGREALSRLLPALHRQASGLQAPGFQENPCQAGRAPPDTGGSRKIQASNGEDARATPRASRSKPTSTALTATTPTTRTTAVGPWSTRRSGITDPTQQVCNNLALMYKEVVGDVENALDFMGAVYRDGDVAHGFGLGGMSEKGSHTGVHIWVGDPRNEFNEDMGNFYSSGRDPAFYCHHFNVDRMWTIWENLPANYSKKIDDDDYKNSAFMFYDEKMNLFRVTVADCLDYKKMGYEYEYNDLPWLNLRPPQKPVLANLKELAKGLPAAGKVFPLKPAKTVKFLVPKPAKGKADEALVLENIVADNTKLVKFDVFINDEDDKPNEVDRAECVWSFTHLPHRVEGKESTNNLRLNLREVYENINIADDDSVVITIVPQFNGDAVTIGGIKIIPRSAK
ncbi:hypothetical protein SASPL_146324 [Salvia splendens]|uniref:Tyrosinase copper-binding domain-containing protein n=1 Tax=Salvia splendens TaxID=180675 RepID=A0A8X8Z5N7_SALSN|nr:hypothetical protein SASPL_146324 [Salvia splendens]